MPQNLSEYNRNLSTFLNKIKEKETIFLNVSLIHSISNLSSVVGRAIRLIGPTVLPKGATLLAPTDLAFREALGEAGLRRLQTNLTALGDIIKRHIIPRPTLSHSLQVSSDSLNLELVLSSVIR